MKKMTLLSLALCAAVMLSLSAVAAEEPSATPVPEAAGLPPVRVWGRVTRQENGSLLLRNDDPQDPNQEIIVHLPEGVPCVDAVTGLPLDMEKVKDGDILYAWVGPAMTLSLPPQSAAQVVVGNLPADGSVPEFYEITGIDQTVTIAIYPVPEKTEVNLPVAGGVLTIPISAQVTPWLTRQIVTLNDLVPGSRVLVWRDADGAVSRVLLLPYGYQGCFTVNNHGEVFVNGEKLAVNAKLAEPDLLPLRAVAEAAGYEVSWIHGQGAVVKTGDNILFTVLPGSETAVRPGNEEGDWPLSAACVIEQGVTYLPANDLMLLLNLYYYNT